MVLEGNNGGAVWLGCRGKRIQEAENEEGLWGSNQEDDSQFKPMLEGDLFSNRPHSQDLQMLQNQQDFRFCGGFPFNSNDDLLLNQSIDPSSSCSPSQHFCLDSSQQNQFLSTNNKSSLLNVPSSANPFDNAFEFGPESGFIGQIHAPMGFGSLSQLGNRDFSYVPDLLFAPSLHASETNNNTMLCTGEGGFSAPLELEGSENPVNGGLAGNKAKVLEPLKVLALSGAQPTLFQKRAAMHQSTDKLNESGKTAESVHNGGEDKGKKKGMPAKNLMAEKRRREKLNDKLIMLRSVVPKISKMDKASILRDAIDYMKELLQRINNLHTEIESMPPRSLP